MHRSVKSRQKRWTEGVGKGIIQDSRGVARSIEQGNLKIIQCLVQIMEADGRKECGRFEFLIMNYKNYSKNSFKMMDGERILGVLHMSINISSV